MRGRDQVPASLQVLTWPVPCGNANKCSQRTNGCGADVNVFVVCSAQVQIVHKRIDLSNVTSKCGSKDNIRHKPGKAGPVLLRRPERP